MNQEYTLKEVIEIATERISSITKHPAILRDAITKKEEPMDIDDGDLLDQIQTANQFVAEIDDCIKIIYKTVKTHYSQRFPEFPDVAEPIQYITIVQILGNKPSKVNEESVKNQLSEFLHPKVQLLITMAAASTQGIKLEPDLMNNIIKTCSLGTHLYSNIRAKLLRFVEENMAVIAPNLSVIVGASIAAKLLGLAGGVRQLATMPSCNVPILGASLNRVRELDLNAPSRIGLIYDCDLIQNIPFDYTKDLRKRAVRWVANKCVLAARCDASHSDSSGEVGKMFRGKIEALINKELEPPPKKAFRPLPAPIEKSGKKRGGKRVRRMKERYAQTELRRAANRMKFGDVSDDTGFSHTVKLRAPQINEKTKIRLSKGTQKKLDGTSSSITFTAEQQGLEIFNPKAAESYAAGTSGETSNYFSNSAGFLKIEKKE